MNRGKLVLKNIDLIYVSVLAVAIILDFIIANKTLSAVIYILILIGFGISLMPSKTAVKDERMLYIKHIAGYSAFLLTALVLLIFAFLLEYIELTMEPASLLRTITESVFFLFTLINAIIKRLV